MKLERPKTVKRREERPKTEKSRVTKDGEDHKHGRSHRCSTQTRS